MSEQPTYWKRGKTGEIYRVNQGCREMQTHGVILSSGKRIPIDIINSYLIPLPQVGEVWINNEGKQYVIPSDVHLWHERTLDLFILNYRKVEEPPKEEEATKPLKGETWRSKNKEMQGKVYDILPDGGGYVNIMFLNPYGHLTLPMAKFLEDWEKVETPPVWNAVHVDMNILGEPSFYTKEFVEQLDNDIERIDAHIEEIDGEIASWQEAIDACIEQRIKQVAKRNEFAELRHKITDFIEKYAEERELR